MEADYIIVGGGLVGCALASRLSQGDSSLKILLIEAGPDPTGNPFVTTPLGAFRLHNSELDWAYVTVPQHHVKERRLYNAAGKALSGGSIFNYGAWSVGDSTDYDEWARVVQDSRWSYDGFLPFLKRVEHYYDEQADAHQHGFDGPMFTTSISASDPKRRYPLREPVRAAWAELGAKLNLDANTGSSIRINEVVENWRDGQRQPSGPTYGLSGVQVINNTLVHRVTFEHLDDGKQVASGVQLVDGRRVSATKEVIICAGTIRTPQVLMLSGIGPANELSKHGVHQLVDAPEVGRNLFDHFSLFQFWKLRHPEEGLSLGTPLWTDPAYFKGMPCDWAIRESLANDLLKTALKADGEEVSDQHSLLRPSRYHTESSVLYAPGGAALLGMDLPMDGSYVATSVMLTLPTSRGSITLESASPEEYPIIDPNYYATQTDRAVLRAGVRRTLQLVHETSGGQDIFESEAPPPGCSPLNSRSTDDEIDDRVRRAGLTYFHAAGSAAMGKVVDTDLRVYGTERLRVADASVLPVPVSAGLQPTLYGIAERTAELILQTLRGEKAP